MRTVRPMRQALAAVLLVLAVSGAALAANGDPQRRIMPADQARAKAMLLRASDLNAAYTSHPSSSSGGGFYCAAIDESDLTVTGSATSPSFTSTAEFVVSRADVYASRADSSASWSRGTSAAGQECLRVGIRRQLQGTAVRLVSFKRLAFPTRGQRSVAYRAIASQQGLRIYVDVVAIQLSRAQASVLYVSGLSPPPQDELRRLTGIVATRASRAMRGSS
jgi:hypothetical protein